jgi:hypothetical protein
MKGVISRLEKNHFELIINIGTLVINERKPEQHPTGEAYD